MSNYKFKGTLVSTITNTTGGVNTSIGPYYSGFPATLATNYTMMKPLPLNYTIPPTSTDVSNFCTASFRDITATETVSVPSGVKKFRYILVGGGGGGGGAGGTANANANSGKSDATGNGGSGSSGNYSTYSYGTVDVVNNTIDITIGTGGNIGNKGGNASQSGGGIGTSPRLAQAGAGGDGNPGNETYITYNSTKLSVSGGNGGKLGNGGRAYAGYSTTNSEPGNTNANTNTIVNYANAMDSNTPPLGTSYGQGGSGVSNFPTVSNGSAGGAGICRIIWLYD